MDTSARRTVRPPHFFSTSIACAVGLLAGAVACLPVPASAQALDTVQIERPAPGVVQLLELRDGSRLYGQVESVTGDIVQFRTVAGSTLSVARTDIVSLRVARGRVEGQRFIEADANRTRLFFGPTGRSLPKGTGYVGIYEFVMPFVQVGVTDRVSVGAGTPLVFASGSGHPVWFTPKVQVYTGRTVQAAVGVMHFLNVDDGDGLGIAYGVATIGSDDSAVSIGAGWGYTRSGDDDDNGDAAIGMIAGERRVSRRIKVITENYVFDGGGILTGGVRFIGDRLSADLGLVAPLGAGEAFVFPIVNFVWVFGDAR